MVLRVVIRGSVWLGFGFACSSGVSLIVLTGHGGLIMCFLSLMTGVLDMDRIISFLRVLQLLVSSGMFTFSGGAVLGCLV